jgi:hypothetical protein
VSYTTERPRLFARCSSGLVTVPFHGCQRCYADRPTQPAGP